MQNLKILILFLGVFSGLFSVKTYAQYASLPFYEGFDNDWTTVDGNYVPSDNWRANDSNGQNFWDRSDQTNWNFVYDGLYSPQGADGTAYSARMHTSRTYETATLDLYLDCSSPTGNKYLSFWFNNKDSYLNANDFNVILSIDGGSTFEDTLYAQNNHYNDDWEQIIIDLGEVNESSCVIRFWAKGNFGGSDIGIDEVIVASLAPDFSSDIIIGNAPLTIKFTDKSDGNPDSWKWDFNNDDIIDATEQNPSFTYTSAGIYTVKLIISKGGITESLTKSDFIQVKEPLHADFSSNVNSGMAPLTVNFSDNSLGNPTSWQWDFDNDGTIDATTQNPSFTYNAAGDYDVKLIISKQGIDSTIIKEDFISVSKTTGIYETSFKPIHIYPNPTNDFVQFDLPLDDIGYLLEVFNSNGCKVVSKKISDNNDQISVMGLSPGLYYLKIVGKKDIYLQKFIKNM